MTELQKIGVTVGADWLPPGSSAETWVGSNCPAAEPAVVTRLLIIRRILGQEPEFFCVPTTRGLNLPTRYLYDRSSRESLSLGTSRLIWEIFEKADVLVRCIGFVRNVVSTPNSNYIYPVPWAHVPVFLVASSEQPIAVGEWLGVDRARLELADRHWWPIVEHYFAGDDG